MGKIGVIGIGNELMGDDGIALLLLREIEDRLDDDIESVLGGTGGMKVVHDLARFDAVLIVDAGELGFDPGDFKIFSPGDAVSIKDTSRYSLHDWDIMRSIEISKQLGEAPEVIRILGIQILESGMGKGISDPLRSRIGEYCDVILEEIGRIRSLL